MKPVPTLTLGGFVHNDDLKIVKLFEYFLAGEKSQSTIFKDSCASLKYILDHNNTETTIEDGITDELRLIYNNYYDDIDIEVDVSENIDKDTWDIDIDITVTDDNGYEHTLKKQILNVSNNVPTYNTEINKYIGE